MVEKGEPSGVKGNRRGGKAPRTKIFKNVASTIFFPS
jgi:hypothetical protein